MPYVQRNAGKIVGIFANKQSYAEEYLEDDHPDLKSNVEATVDQLAIIRKAILTGDHTKLEAFDVAETAKFTKVSDVLINTG